MRNRNNNRRHGHNNHQDYIWVCESYHSWTYKTFRSKVSALEFYYRHNRDYSSPRKVSD